MDRIGGYETKLWHLEFPMDMNIKALKDLPKVKSIWEHLGTLLNYFEILSWSEMPRPNYFNFKVPVRYQEILKQFAQVSYAMHLIADTTAW